MHHRLFVADAKQIQKQIKNFNEFKLNCAMTTLGKLMHFVNSLCEFIQVGVANNTCSTWRNLIYLE